MASNRSHFVYVTYIRTTPGEAVVGADRAEFMKQYWFGMTAKASGRRAPSWKLVLRRRR